MARQNYHLVIKGNRFQAAAAAAQRGIPFAFPLETKIGETCGYAPAEYGEAIRTWFLENCDRAAPYPAGSLMVYRTL